ncbi:hypothetical protein [Echinicola shivajiensis]|uniref:hypothetical protein n=1 Tax=Echinicola shivajiensis TaxID=1035916 RepID=UPI001BFC9A3B|nr:hypothetical protein [Echinicola shivajiensis]
MGFIPILLTFGGFVFLFALVVNQSIKAKKEQYKTALSKLADSLNLEMKDQDFNIDKIEAEIKKVQDMDSQKTKSLKVLLGKVKLLRHQYNELIATKPYSFVAKSFGYRAI